MRLMTKALEKRFAAVGAQEDTDNPLVVARFFSPGGQEAWYAISYNAQTQIFFGYMPHFHDAYLADAPQGADQLGFFCVQELKDFRRPNGSGVIRDLNWQEKRLSEVFPDLYVFQK